MFIASSKGKDEYKLNTIDISEIIIPNKYKQSTPSLEKIKKVKSYLITHGEIDSPIVLNGGVLCDGYIRYLVAKELNITTVPYVTVNEYVKPTVYIGGKFKNCNKEYTWKVPDRMNVNVGDKVLVRTKCRNCYNGIRFVTVTRVFTSIDINMLKHKSVVKIK